jgi:UDP-N-acetylmuramate dehydrogenase
MICPEAFMKEMTVFQQKMADYSAVCELRFDEPMAKHTSFRIGGNVEVFAMPKTREELAMILHSCKAMNIKPAILGAGTNVLAPDAGLDGIVICLKDCLDGMEQLDETHIRVMAGVTMTRAAMFAANLGLGGMEFAHGIPGTVGGGVYMNAGAYGGEMKDIVESVEIMDLAGNIRTITKEEMAFSYRHSRLEDTQEIVISAVFSLSKGDKEEIIAKIRELQAKRSASQPLNMPSAGSAFKRPAQGYAAALIDQTGLKGYQVGGAAISTKHAGFAVNLGGATASVVQNLLSQVSDKVFDATGIRLEPEVRIW